MKRSLVLLLVVALLAMMIPGMALAEDVKFTITGSYTKELVRGTTGTLVVAQNLADAGVVGTITGLEAGYIEWKSSDKSALVVEKSTSFEPGNTGFLPSFIIIGHTEAGQPATITGTLYKDNESRKPLGTASFNVTLSLVKEEKITFYEDKTKQKETDKYTIVVGEGNLALQDLAKVTPDGTVEGTKGSTYSEEDLQWTISDSKIASIDKEGNVHAVKAGSTTVTATAKGNPAVTASVTITVEEYPEPTPTKKAFTKVEFTSSEFTYASGDALIQLDRYLVTEPLPMLCDDEIAWISSDPSIATVDLGMVYFQENAKDGDKVEITAKSILGDKSATATITFKEKDPFESFHFVKDSFKVKMENNLMNLWAYLNIDNPKSYNSYDDIIFTSSDPQIIDVNDDGQIILHEPGTVTITARSMRNPKAAPATCTIELVVESLKSISFTSDVPKKLKQGNRFDLWNYIDTDPYYYAHNVYDIGSYSAYITFEATDPQLVTIDGSSVYANKGIAPGKTSIKAVYDDHKNPAVKSKAFTLEIEPIPVGKAAFKKKTFTIKKGMTIKLSEEPYFKMTPYDARGYTRKFESSDPEIVEVEEESWYDDAIDQMVYGARATGMKAGTATITATVRNADGTVKKATCKVTVTDQALTAIAFRKKAYTVNLSNNPDANNKTVYLKLTPADADVDWNDIHIESSDPEIVRIEAYGMNENGAYCTVTSMQPGKATVTVSSRSNPAITAKTKVTVVPIALKYIKYESKIEKKSRKITALMYEGAEMDQNKISVSAKVSPADAYFEDKWETSDASVAYISGNTFNGSESESVGGPIFSQKIVLAGPGTCTIKLTVTDGTTTKTRSFKLTVKAAKVSKLALNKTAATAYLVKGGDNTLQLEAYDAKTNYPVPVTWATSNKKIATVDRFGLVTFKKAGKVKIAATTKDGNKTKKYCTLTVKQLKVTKITPVNKTITLRVGQEKPVKVTITPAKAYNPVLAYKSSKPKVVTVDSEGNLFPLMLGKSVITITAKDGSKKTAKVTVVVKAAVINNDVKVDAIEDGMDLSFEGDVLNGIGDISNLEIDGGIGLTIE